MTTGDNSNTTADGGNKNSSSSSNLPELDAPATAEGNNNNNNDSSSSSSSSIKTTKGDDDEPPQRRRRLRIVSLLPSITEILCSLGVGDDIVGITHECDYPEHVVNNINTRVVTTSEINPRTLTQSEIHAAVVGSLAQGNSLYGLNHDVLRAVQPDIIFTQSLCDVCAVSYPVVLDTCAKILAGPKSYCGIIENSEEDDDDSSPPGSSSSILKRKEPLVISMEPNNLQDVLATFYVAARALGPATVQRADLVVRDLQLGFETIRRAVAAKVAPKHKNSSSPYKKPTVAFMEWHCPIFSGGHWIPDMIEIAGGDYSMCQSGDRSAAWTDEDFATLLDPDVILIGPCGFSLERAVQDTLALYRDTTSRGQWWKQLRAVQTNRVYALDGNSYYARPGPRLLQGCGIMARCIHDDDTVEFLWQELAPSSGYCRITPDMWCTASRKKQEES